MAYDQTYPSQTGTGSAPKALHRAMAIIGVGLMVTTLAQTQVIGRLPLQFLLKGRLGLTPEAMALFFAVATLPWELKILAGLLSDSVPLLGTRRRYYLIASSAMAAGLWLALACVPRTFAALLIVAVGLNAALMLASTVTGALLVERGQEYHATGRLSALRLVAMNGAAILGGPASGLLATLAWGWTAGAGAALCAGLALCAWWVLCEPGIARRNLGLWRAAGRQFRQMLGARTLWSAAGMLLLVQISPGFATPLFYYQTNALHLGAEFLGLLAVVSGTLGILGALLYGWLCKRITLRWLLAMGILLATLSTLLYLRYVSATAAVLIEATAGLLGTLAQLPLFDLAARATPRGSEALGYALMMSVWNLGASGSDVLGSWLYDHYHLTFMNLVWLNAGTTLLALVAVPLLPAALVAGVDRAAAEGSRNAL